MRDFLLKNNFLLNYSKNDYEDNIKNKKSI